MNELINKYCVSGGELTFWLRHVEVVFVYSDDNLLEKRTWHAFPNFFIVMLDDHWNSQEHIFSLAAILFL